MGIIERAGRKAITLASLGGAVGSSNCIPPRGKVYTFLFMLPLKI
jgi:hypothetical protein